MSKLRDDLHSTLRPHLAGMLADHNTAAAALADLLHQYAKLIVVASKGDPVTAGILVKSTLQTLPDLVSDKVLSFHDYIAEHGSVVR